MDCPHCKDQRLSPVKLEQDLPALQCGECHGSLVSLLVYRRWSETHPIVGEPEGNIEEEADETRCGLLCPKCHRLMQKFSISAESKHKIDLCTHCDEAWLDQGEWQLLKHLELADQLPSIFTQPWQHHIKQEAFAKKRLQRWQEILGDDFEKAQAFREWLNGHPHKDELLRYLNEH